MTNVIFSLKFSRTTYVEPTVQLGTSSGGNSSGENSSGGNSSGGNFAGILAARVFEIIGNDYPNAFAGTYTRGEAKVETWLTTCSSNKVRCAI
jgi:hypothetical protein